MLKAGITGGIGSGKSTVCRIFKMLHVPVFNADEESKQIIQSDPAVVNAVKEKFGEEIYPDGILDRKKLAGIVFADPEKLKTLNAITHPAVFRKFENWANEHHRDAYIIKEAALIYETGADNHLDKIIVVTAPEALRVHRIQARDQVTEDEVKARMKNQWPEEEKLKRADFIIHNDGEQLLIPQVMQIHEHFMKEDEKLHIF